MSTPTDSCISICNKLVRGELSAVETYGQTIRKHSDSPAIGELRRIHGEHQQAADRLTANVRSMGGEPETDSGAWGAFASTVQGAASLFGAGSALESLQRGEEAGRKDYEDALTDEDVMPECKTMIREELLPGTIAHIAALEKLGKYA